MMTSESGLDPQESLPQELFAAETVNLSQVSAGKVQAELARVNQSTVGKLVAEEVEVRSGLVRQLKAQNVSMQQCVTLAAQTGSLVFANGNIGIVQAGDAEMTNGAASFVQCDTAEVHDSTVSLIVGRNVHANSLHTTVLLVGRVDGNVVTLMDTRRAALAGLVGGVVAGLVLFAVRLLSNRKGD